jgi:hypothetical protein
VDVLNGHENKPSHTRCFTLGCNERRDSAGVNGMALVAVVAIAFALVVVSPRSASSGGRCARSSGATARSRSCRKETSSGTRFLVGQQIEATPRERPPNGRPPSIRPAASSR